MDFDQLMLRASQNCGNSTKQKRKPGHLHKDNTSQVSSSAVKAFLEKKKLEQQKKQSQEEIARRARIAARIEQNLKQKKGTKNEEESSVSNPPQTNKQEGSSKQKHKQKPERDVSSSDKRNRDSKTRKDSHKHKQRDEKIRNNSKTLPTNKQLGKERGKVAKTKKHPPPTNFKELLAIAEQNKLGLPKQNKEAASKQDETSKTSKKIKEKTPKPQQQRPECRTKKEPPKTRTSMSATVNKKEIKTSQKPIQNSLATNASSRPPMKRSNPNQRTSPWQQGSIHRNKRQCFSHYDDEEDEEEDLDGFIDDEGFEGEGNVSSYIREIFGYDRRRFADDDLDDSAMESSFSQIEKEEQRSSKIAKLEDEVAFLKEQAELKREKERLMKRKKTKR